ncbi:MAG: hypothetical protein ACREDL_22975 [Bradyrhizobium sp.]
MSTSGKGMFDTVILVTGPVEQTALAPVLRAHNPQLTIRPVTTPDDMAALDQAALTGDRLVAFATSMIAPPEIRTQAAPVAGATPSMLTCR